MLRSSPFIRGRMGELIALQPRSPDVLLVWWISMPFWALNRVGMKKNPPR
jgi:hypothetical protein